MSKTVVKCITVIIKKMKGTYICIILIILLRIMKLSIFT